MTREEAIKIFNTVLFFGKCDCPKEEIEECFNMAIKALEQEPTDDATLKDIFCMGCEYKEQEPCREADDYENEISDLHNRLDIAEYDKERLKEEVTTLEEKLKGLSAEPCEDAISRQAVLALAKKDCETAIIPYRRFVKGINALPSVTPQYTETEIQKMQKIEQAEIQKAYELGKAEQRKVGHCKDCKWWKDSDGAFRRGIGAESQCPLNREEVYEGNGYCYMFEPQKGENKK